MPILHVVQNQPAQRIRRDEAPSCYGVQGIALGGEFDPTASLPASVMLMDFDPEAGMLIHDERMSLRPVSTFKTAYPALRREFADADFKFTSEGKPVLLPVDPDDNTFRSIATGRLRLSNAAPFSQEGRH